MAKLVLSFVIMFILFTHEYVTPQENQVRVAGQMLIDGLEDARSSYSQAMTTSNTSDFQVAINSFLTLSRLIDSSNLKSRYEKIYNLSKYGEGWCKFRLAEKTGELDYLRDAFSIFSSLPVSDENVGVYSSYMAGESKLREAILRKYELLERRESFLPDELSNSLNTARSKFLEVSNSNFASTNLKTCAKIRIQDIEYAKGKIHQVLNENNTSSQHLNTVNYGALIGEMSGISLIKTYSEAMKCLDLYLIDEINDPCNNLITSASNFGNESNFRLANKAQKDGLWKNAEAFYQQAVSGRIMEGYYWLGFMQLILNKVEAINNFRNFVNNTSPTQDRRTILLREDANRRINMHTGEVSSLNVDNFLSGETEEQRRIESLTNAKYLLKIAAGKVIAVDQTPYLQKVYVFLDRAQSSQNRDEISFYRGIAKSMEVGGIVNTMQKAEAYREVAADMSNIIPSSKFKDEAEYIRGLCLFRAWDFNSNDIASLDQAERVFIDLINKKNSVRALYYLGSIYSARNNHSAAIHCYNIVKEKTRNIPEYNFLSLDAEAGLNECLEASEGEKLEETVPQEVDSRSVVCPDYLISNETIFYEKIADWRSVLQDFGAESLEQLKKFGLPKKSIYPTENRLKGSIFSANSFDNFSAQIPEIIPVDYKWDLKVLVLNAKLKELNDCKVISTKDGYTLTLDGKYYVKKSIPLGLSLGIQISKHEYYPSFHEITSDEIGVHLYTLILSEKIEEYNHKGEEPCQTNCQLFRPYLDGNFVMHNFFNLPIDPNTQLVKDFESSVGFRDFVYDAKSQRFLAVNCRNGKALWEYNKDGYSDAMLPLTFRDSNDSLSSPEGIAVDSDGNIYVADWGNHRVLVFDKDGKYLDQFGNLGEDLKENAEKKAKLIFPTRVAIEEDTNGINFEGKKIYREKHILVADRYGIHKFDSKGHYLDTLINKENSDLEEGSFYAFTIKGYGKGSEIYLINREKRKVFLFSSQN